MNVYGLGSALTVRGPMGPTIMQDDEVLLDVSNVTDWSARAQAKTLLPWGMNVGYTRKSDTGSSGSTGKPGGGLIAFEKGFIDETNADYVTFEWEFIGRTTSSVFQDNPTADTLPRNVTGAALVQHFCSKYGIPFDDQGPDGGNVALGKAWQDANYQMSLRNSTAWDYMQDAALADGVIISDHLGTIYYGPPGGLNPPTIQLDYGRDFSKDRFRVLHSARHSHAIKVMVMGYDHKKLTRIVEQYGTSRGDETTFRFWTGVTDRHKARGEAYAIYMDLVKKEMIAELTLTPDDELIKLIGQQGPNFLVQIGGVVPSHRQLYHVKQVGVNINALSENPELKVNLLLENHKALAGGGTYA